MGRRACSFVLRVCGGGKEKKRKKRSSFVACVAVSLLFCFTPVGWQASSFILRLCGGGKEKEKKKEVVVLLPVWL